MGLPKIVSFQCVWQVKVPQPKIQSLITSPNCGSLHLDLNKTQKLLNSTVHFSYSKPTRKFSVPVLNDAQLHDCIGRHKPHWPNSVINPCKKDVLAAMDITSLQKFVLKYPLSLDFVVSCIEGKSTLNGPYLHGSTVLGMTPCAGFLPSPSDIDLVIEGGSVNDAIDAVIWGYLTRYLPGYLKSSVALLSKTDLDNPLFSDLLDLFKDRLILQFKAYFLDELFYPSETVTHFKIGAFEFTHTTQKISQTGGAACSKNGGIVHLGQVKKNAEVSVVSPHFPKSEVEVHIGLNIRYSNKPIYSWMGLRHSLDYARSKSVPLSPWTAFQCTYALWHKLMVECSFRSPQATLAYRLKRHLNSHYQLNSKSDAWRALEDLTMFYSTLHQCIPDNHPGRFFRDRVWACVRQEISESIVPRLGQCSSPPNSKNVYPWLDYLSKVLKCPIPTKMLSGKDASLFFLCRYAQFTQKGVKAVPKQTVDTLIDHALRYVSHTQKAGAPIKSWSVTQSVPSTKTSTERSVNDLIMACWTLVEPKNAQFRSHIEQFRTFLRRLASQPQFKGQSGLLKSISKIVIPYIVSKTLAPELKIAPQITVAAIEFCHSNQKSERLIINIMVIVNKFYKNLQQVPSQMAQFLDVSTVWLQDRGRWHELYRFSDFLFPSPQGYLGFICKYCGFLRTSKEASKVPSVLSRALKLYPATQYRHTGLLDAVIKVLQVPKMPAKYVFVRLWMSLICENLADIRSKKTSSYAAKLLKIGALLCGKKHRKDICQIVKILATKHRHLDWLDILKSLAKQDANRFFSVFSAELLADLRLKEDVLLSLYLDAAQAQGSITNEAQWKACISVHKAIIGRLNCFKLTHENLNRINEVYEEVYLVVQESPFNKNGDLPVRLYDGLSSVSIRIPNLWLHAFCWAYSALLKGQIGSEQESAIFLKALSKFEKGMGVIKSKEMGAFDASVMVKFCETVLSVFPNNKAIHLKLLSIAAQYECLIQTKVVMSIFNHCVPLFKTPLQPRDSQIIIECLDTTFFQPDEYLNEFLPGPAQIVCFIKSLQQLLASQLNHPSLRGPAQVVIIRLCSKVLLDFSDTNETDLISDIQQVAKSAFSYLDHVTSLILKLSQKNALSVNDLTEVLDAIALYSRYRLFCQKQQLSENIACPASLVRKLFQLLPMFIDLSENPTDEVAYYLNCGLDIVRLGLTKELVQELVKTDEMYKRFIRMLILAKLKKVLSAENLTLIDRFKQK